MRTRVKICGLTREDDIRSACDLGADAIGMVFYPPSPRHLSLERAARLRREVPVLVSMVALFVNPAEQEVRAVIEQLRPNVLQFHGEESLAFCEQFGLPYFKAFRVGGPGMDSAEDLALACRAYPSAAAWLFDSYSTGYGGSGLSFEGALLDQVRAMQDTPPLIVSGGLQTVTVGGVIRHLHPYAVDVSSGVEESKGVKSVEKIAAFLRAVREADGVRGG